MTITNSRRYRHTSNTEAFHAIADDGWEIPVPQSVQRSDGWRQRESDVLVGIGENENFDYYCCINVGRGGWIENPDAHLLPGWVDFIPLPIPVSVIISMVTPGDTIARESHSTETVMLRMRWQEGRGEYASRNVRVRYCVLT